jgi:hypothetical protein
MCDALIKFEAMRYELHAKMLSDVEALSDSELDELRRECAKQTTTNCSWAKYDAARHAGTMASLEANRRADTEEPDNQPTE